MPGKVKVRILAGRNLPVMDRSSDTTDAYVEVKLGSVTHKTEVFRKSLNPQWNSDWFIFEVDDQDLQDEPLQIRLMDHDTYSANDAIGKVYVDLNPLLLPPPGPPHHSQRPQDPSQPGTAVMSGWLPVYDTMHGIRGEVSVVVKVDLFSDFNKFRQSSCGVQFFFTPEIPAGYRCQSISGFVEELVVNDDPEYQWIDKIRTPRASNEARQTLFSKLTGELQRRIGLKVLELGGNAVIGYRQYFDLEGETGIVVRGLGSAVTLVRLHYESALQTATHSPSPLREIGVQREPGQQMPITVVHLPSDVAHRISTVSAPPSSLLYPPQALPAALHLSQSFPMNPAVDQQLQGLQWSSSQSPSQWLDLMVPPVPSHIQPRHVGLSGARRVIRGLPLVKKKRSVSTVTRHPSVFLQRQASLVLNPTSHPSISPAHTKSHRSRSWTTSTPTPSGPPDGLGTIRAGLRKTAQRVMRLRPLEKSYSFDQTTQHTHSNRGGAYRQTRPGNINMGNIGLKVDKKSHRAMGRLLKGRGNQRNKQDGASGLLPPTRESLTSPDDSVEDCDLDSPDVVEFEDEAADHFSDDDQEVTNIEFSYKGVSPALSDPTLNKSIYARTYSCHSQAPLSPIQFISSESEDGSLGSSSTSSSPSRELKAPRTGGKFYLSEESIASHFTGPLDPAHDTTLDTNDSLVDLIEKATFDPVDDSVFNEPCDEKKLGRELKNRDERNNAKKNEDLSEMTCEESSVREIKKEDKGDVSVGTEKIEKELKKAALGLDILFDYDSVFSVSQHRQQQQQQRHEQESQNQSSGDQQEIEKLRMENAKQCKGREYKQQRTDKEDHHDKTLTLTTEKKGTRLNILPAIAVIPSTPVLPTKALPHSDQTSRSTVDTDSDPGIFFNFDPNSETTSYLSKFSAFSSFSLPSTSFQNASYTKKPDSSISSSSLSLSSIKFPFSCTKSQTLHVSKSAPSFPSCVVSSCCCVCSTLPERACVGVVAKCDTSHPWPPTPCPILPACSHDLPSDARPRSAPTAGSPRRCGVAPRSRHTSGCYPVSRSPCPPPEGTEVAPAPAHSPTHSGKLTSPSRTPGVSINRRSSDSDLSITPKGSSLAGSGGSSGGGGGTSTGRGGAGGGVGTGSHHRPLMTQESFDLLEYPFLTMKTFPPGFILHLGGTVSARSVKLLERPHTPEEVETRDNWWTQLRMEVRSHCRALVCNVVLGYEEFTTISDEVIVLNATGTAAVISLHYLEVDGMGAGLSRVPRDHMTLSLDRKDFEQQQQQQGGKAASYKDSHSGSQVCLRHRVSSPRPLKRFVTCMSRSHPCIEDGMSGEGGGGGSIPHHHPVPPPPPPPPPPLGPPPPPPPPSPPPPPPPSSSSRPSPCVMCHVPYSETSLPFRVKISKCAVCRKGKVPDVLFTTLEPPAGMPITGIGCLIQARVIRTKKDLKGELNAKEISDSLPFLEYELHKQLINKMKIKGMNALFGLRVRVTVGERLLVGVGTATGVFLAALQSPPVPRVTSGGTGQDNERRRVEVQRKLHSTIAKNKEAYGTRRPHVDMMGDEVNGGQGSDTEDSEDDLPEIDLSSGNKDTSVLELDDIEDLEMIGLLVEAPPVPLVAVSTQYPPGVPEETLVTNLQMFTRVWRTKVPQVLNHHTFSNYFDKLFQSVFFKVRKLAPCVIAGLQVNVELPEEDELQISILGMILGQGHPSALPSQPHQLHHHHSLLHQQAQPSASTTTIQSDIPQKKAKQDDGEMIFKMEELISGSEEPTVKTKQQQQYQHPSSSSLSITNVPSFPSLPSSSSFSSSGGSSLRSSLRSRPDHKIPTNQHCAPKERYGVEITPLSYVPGARIECHLGNLNFFFIRESTSIKESGGLSGFMGSFVTEVLALVRAHVAALGGNAMIAYFMSECVLLHNPFKNQGQCLINVGGDVVQVQYNPSLPPQDSQPEE